MKTRIIAGFGENTDLLSVPAVTEFYAQQEPKLWVGTDLLGFFTLDDEDL